MIPEFEAAEAAVDGATAAPTATTLISSDAIAAKKWRLKDRPDIFILPFGGPLLFRVTTALPFHHPCQSRICAIFRFERGRSTRAVADFPTVYWDGVPT